MSHKPFSFRVTHSEGSARRGTLETPHGAVQTPAFMPVGTRGAIKGLTFRDVRDAGAEIILGNTYHLHLRPGDELIARAGGLHAFIGWPHPILTDSGGYQVFSLAAMRKVTEERGSISGSFEPRTSNAEPRIPIGHGAIGTMGAAGAWPDVAAAWRSRDR